MIDYIGKIRNTTTEELYKFYQILFNTYHNTDYILNLYEVKRIAVISPYWPVSDKNVTLFFEDCGFEVRKFRGLKCPTPVAIAHVQPEDLRQHVIEMNDDSIDAFVQVGTNLSMVELCNEMAIELKKPMFPINAATYWHALRSNGLKDQFEGHGPLFQDH